MTEALTTQVTAALAEMHRDPFVQTAILRLFQEAPGLLDASVVVCLTAATIGDVEYVQYPQEPS